MATREELHAMVDTLSEDQLEPILHMMKSHVTPAVRAERHPEMDRMRERAREFRNRVEEQFRLTQKPGTISGFGGGGSTQIRDGAGHQYNSFNYWKGEELVRQSLQTYRGIDMETMDHFSISEDRSELIYTQELASCGRTVRREERFPIDRKA